MKSAFQKLTQKDLKPENIEENDLELARKIAVEIEEVANKLAKAFFDFEKFRKRFKVTTKKKKKYK